MNALDNHVRQLSVSTVTRPIPFRTPLRYAVPRPNGKPKPVTVCIAAACKTMTGEPRIVLCADTRLEYQYTGSNDGNPKIGRLAYGWFAMLSGNDWMAAKDIHGRIKSELRTKGPPADMPKFHRMLTRIAKAYVKSPLNAKALIDVIVAGFIGREAIIATLSVSVSDEITVLFAPSYKAVGSGASIAETFLNIRDCKPQDELERTAYVVYEAKKYSEKASGVGPETRMKVLAPLPPGALAGQFMFIDIPDAGYAQLEEYRVKNGIQKIEHLPIWIGMPQLRIEVPPDPQHPTADPSDPKPLQE
jgi:hypothetical protein